MKKILLIIIALLITFSFNLEVKAYSGFELTDEVVQIDDETPYQIQYTGDITGLRFDIANTFKPSNIPFEDPVATVTNSGVVTGIRDGVVTVRVSCVESEDLDCMNYIFKIKDTLTILVNVSEEYTDSFTAIMELFNEKKIEANTEINKITTTNINANFVRSLMTHSFDITDDITNEVKSRFKNFGQEFISLQFPDFHSQVENLQLSYTFVDDILEIRGKQNPFTFNVIPNEGSEKTPFYAHIAGPKTNKKVITFTYPDGNEADETAVKNFAKTLPVNNKSYIDLSLLDRYTLDEIINRQFEGSEIEEAISSKGFDAYVDYRRGEGGIDPFSAGHIVLGKNGVYYTAQEFKMWSTLKLPKSASKNVIESIQNYFETYLDGLEEIIVEKVEGMTDVYRVYIKEREQLTFWDKIMNFFIPTVYADEEEFDKVITFAVEESEEEAKTNNPQTGVPNLIIYTSLAVLSGLGLALTLKKKNN